MMRMLHYFNINMVNILNTFFFCFVGMVCCYCTTKI